MSNDYPQDDGRPWGFMSKALGAWIELPKVPLLEAGLGPPPFTVRMPDGHVRHVVHAPPFAKDGVP
jgi:hypothetical protein